MSVVAYRPLAMGLLHEPLASTDQLPRRSPPRPSALPARRPRARPHGVARPAPGRRPAGSQAVRLALAWLLATGNDIVVMPGTSSLTHLEMNLAAVNVALTPAEQAELTALATTQTEAL